MITLHFFKRSSFLLFLFVFLSHTPIGEAKTIKVLAIGNSFSVDAAEAYLDDIAKAAEVKMLIGNCDLGGCSLARHWSNAIGDSALYAYRKIRNGDSTLLLNQTLKQCLQDEKWDYITLQQVSHNAGIYETYFPYITNLMTYIRENSKNKDVKFALHQTWAYAANSTHWGFKNYDNDQLKMYTAVMNTQKSVVEEIDVQLIIPSGTAIQNARNSKIGDHLCRDGFHLSLGLGRYTAACVWFETFSGESVIQTIFKPISISDNEAAIARGAAHAAVNQPYALSVVD